MPRLPPLNALRCFEAAARHKSFSKAADELHVTQSAVSHQIRLLESWFATRLFIRSGRDTAPTPRGIELAEALAASFRIMGDACRRAESPEGSGGLTIGVLPSIATIWLIPRLQAFFTAQPSIPVKIVYAIHGRPSGADDLDIAIQWGVTPDTPGKASAFLPGTTVAVGNATLIARLGPFMTPGQLIGAPLLHDLDKTGWQNFMRAAGLKNAGPVSGPTFEDFNLLRAAALAGQGLALCPLSLIADDVAAGRLSTVLPDVAIMKDHNYWLVEPEAAPAQNREQVGIFKAWLLEAARAGIS